MLKPKAEAARHEPVTGLLSEPRRRRILDWIQEEGSARVRELAVAFQVSEATIRQDLERLEQEGQLTREHGGAFLNTVPAQVGTMTLHHQENMEQKRRIGAMAADLVKDGETIILDAGTTTTEIALRLVNRRNLTWGAVSALPILRRTQRLAMMDYAVQFVIVFLMVVKPGWSDLAIFGGIGSVIALAVLAALRPVRHAAV